MTETRRRDAAATRAALLAAARRKFGASGFDRVSLRQIAADAQVDPALVIRYFGTKESLFAEAADFDLRIPDLAGASPDEVVRTLLDRVFAVWDDGDGGFLSLLRASATNPRAAERMLELFAEQVAPALAGAAVDRPGQRAGLFGAQLLGVAMSRYVLRVPAVVAMSPDEVRAWLTPPLRYYLFDAELAPPLA